VSLHHLRTTDGYWLSDARQKTQQRRWSSPLLSVTRTTVMHCAMASPMNCRTPSDAIISHLCSGTRRCDHISPELSQLHWLPVRQCVVFYCDSSLPVPVQQCPRLPGRRLSARRQCPCQTTAFCRHSNTRCQSDAQQF